MKWEERHKQFVFNNQYGRSVKELTEMFNREFGTELSDNAVNAFRKRNNLKNGRDGRYQKGNIPFSKGKTWEDYMPKESQEACKKGWKNLDNGHIGKPVGSERIDKDGKCLLKVKDGKWVNKSVFEWEKVNEKLPEHFKIIRLDQNRSNCNIENLVAVSNKELLYINKNIKLTDDPEINKHIIALCKLKLAIYEKEKKNE